MITQNHLLAHARCLRTCAADSWLRWCHLFRRQTQSPDLKLYLHPLWPEAPLISPFRGGGDGGGGLGSGSEDGGWKGTGKQMASYLSLLCEGCHSNRLMQGLGKEKKRQRQSRKGLGKTIEPRATGQICRLGHNRWSFFNRQGQLLQATCAAVPCFKRSHALFTYDSANG